MSSRPLAAVVAVPGQDPPDDEIDDQAPDGPEELGDLHELARFVGLLDDRMLAVRLHRRPVAAQTKSGPRMPASQ